MTVKPQVRRGIMRGPGTLERHPAHSPNLDERSEPMNERTCSVDGCTRPHVARGWCDPHYRRWRRYGDPHHSEIVDTSMSTVERFWAKVQRGEPDECWEWISSARNGPDGYGVFWDDGHLWPAHRWSYVHHKGPVPDGLIVMHDCDNKVCVNPAHLTAGTYSQNNRDAVARGLRTPPRKLADAQVAEMRRRYAGGERGIDLAREFGIGKSYTFRILRGDAR